MAISKTALKVLQHLNPRDLLDQGNKLRNEGLYKYFHLRFVAPERNLKYGLLERGEFIDNNLGIKNICRFDKSGESLGIITLLLGKNWQISYLDKVDKNRFPDTHLIFVPPTINRKRRFELGMLRVDDSLKITELSPMWKQDNPELLDLRGYIYVCDSGDLHILQNFSEAQLKFPGRLMRGNWYLDNNVKLDNNEELRRVSNCSNSYNGIGIAQKDEYSIEKKIFTFTSGMSGLTSLSELQKYLTIELGREGYKKWQIVGSEFNYGGIARVERNHFGALKNLANVVDYKKFFNFRDDFILLTNSQLPSTTPS